MKLSFYAQQGPASCHSAASPFLIIGIIIIEISPELD